MERRLTELWYRPDGGAALLEPLAWAYGALVRARRSAYTRGWLEARRAGKPVVVIGNLTVGGTGKTPLTIWLAERLTAQGLAVGIVSRGYRRAGSAAATGDRRSRSSVPRFVESSSPWQSVGDEPVLIRRHTGCPTVVCADRVAGARALAAHGVDAIIADDGLQHLRLARDCEIALIDGARGFGNGRLLPAGPLREPASRLREVDLVVVNGHGPGAAAPALVGVAALPMRLVASGAQRVDGHESARPLASFAGERVHAVAGIGHPARFFRDLESVGLEVIAHAFPDHHPFAAAELDFGDGRPVLMTEKDAVRCADFATERMWYVPVRAVLEEADASLLLARVRARIDAAAARAR